MGAFNTFAYAKKYFVSDEIEFVEEVLEVTGEDYKIPEDLINLLADNLIVNNVGVFGSKVGIGTTDILSPREELDVIGTAIISENVGIGTTQPQQKLDVSGSVKIDFNIFDSANSPGKNGYSLFRDARGIRWIPVLSDGAQPGVGFGTILAGFGATPGREGIFVLDDGTPIYSYDDTI